MSTFGDHNNSEFCLMPLIGPSSRGKGPHKGGARKQELHRIYGNPLPTLLEPPSLGLLNSFLGTFGLSVARVTNPHCRGVYDPITNSVWIVDETDSNILWRRGFFGKGDLSRSEPSWLARRKKDMAAQRGNSTLHLSSVIRL